MKSQLIIILLLAFCQIINGQEDRDSLLKEYYKENPAKLIVKTNPLTILTGPIVLTSEYRLAFERVTLKKQSLQIEISYLGKGPLLRSLEKTDTTFLQNHTKLKVNGFRLQFSYKIYFSKKTLKGPYIAPHISISSVKFKNANQPQAGNFVQAIYKNYVIKGGYQFLINRKLAIDIFLGYGYKENSWDEVRNYKYNAIDETDLYYIREPIKIYLGFNIGLAF
ncbi:MAG: hypothetical protein A2046_01170 [Bacteroidetes bacterium GWA2_30_7]|nr:MAG: hypothetical protein A2046_01170 [Bacteroidetes bacterium GWA2_30_7]